MEKKNRAYPNPTTRLPRFATTALLVLATLGLAPSCKADGETSTAAPESTASATDATLVQPDESQTLRVSRSETSIIKPPSYEGESIELSNLDGTTLDYVRNSSSPVLRSSDNTWFTCEDGIWFTSETPDGPWRVATAIPWSIGLIPDNHPFAFLKHARHLGYDGEDVWIELLPGYFAGAELSEKNLETTETLGEVLVSAPTQADNSTTTINDTVTNTYDFSDYDSLSIRLRPRVGFFWDVGFGFGLSWRSNVWWPFYNVWWSCYPPIHYHRRHHPVHHYRHVAPWHRPLRAPVVFRSPVYTRQWVVSHRPPPMSRPVITMTHPRGVPRGRPVVVHPSKPVIIKPIAPGSIGRPVVAPRPPVRRPPNRPGVIWTPGKPTHPIVPRPGPIQRPDVRPRPAPPPGRPGGPWHPIGKPPHSVQPTPPPPKVPPPVISTPRTEPRPVQPPSRPVQPPSRPVQPTLPPRAEPRPVQPPSRPVQPTPPPRAEPRPVQPTPSPPPRVSSPSPAPPNDRDSHGHTEDRTGGTPRRR